MTIEKTRERCAMLGPDNVLPFILLIGIQPNTPLEHLMIGQGYLKPDYNPLSLNPFVIKKRLCNPEPRGRLTMKIIERDLNRMPSGSNYRSPVAPRIPVLNARE